MCHSRRDIPGLAASFSNLDKRPKTASQYGAAHLKYGTNVSCVDTIKSKSEIRKRKKKQKTKIEKKYVQKCQVPK